MPYRRKRKPARRGRRSRRGYRKNYTMMKSPVPTRFKTKLRYATTKSWDPAIGTAAVRVFSCNGIYDPDITGVGHQPRGFDQWMAMYDHVVAIGAKITVRFANATTSSGPKTIGIAIRDTATASVDVNDYQESGYVRSGVLPQDTSSKLTLSYAVNPNKFLSRSKPLSDPDLKNDATHNPNEQAYFHVYAQSIDEGIDVSEAIADVIIDYTVIFLEPKTPAQS